jgi:NDP-sugar pyrophosphorylase family protein
MGVYLNTIPNIILLCGGAGLRLGRITSFGKNIPFGNMNKVTLPIANRPNVNRLIDVAGAQYPASTVYISCGYMTADVIATVNRGRFSNPEMKKVFVLRDRPMNIGMALWDIAKNSYKDRFKDNEYFMVMAGDTSFPGVDLIDFQKKFMEYAKSHPDTLGAYGFVMRPVAEFEKEHHTALLNADGSIEKIEEIPYNKIEAEEISKKSTHEAIKNFYKETGERGLPMSTAIWIFSTKIFDVVPPPDESNKDMVYDIGKYILPKLPGRIYGHIFPEPIVDGKLVRYYSGLDCAEYFYRAQSIFVRNACADIPGVFTHKYRSWLADNVKINRTAEIQESIIGNWATIGKGCSVKQSIIGPGCRIHGGVTLEGAVILPYTYINLIHDHGRIERIAYSIAGGKMRGGTFLDYENMVHGQKVIDGAVAVPNIDGFTELSDLALTDEDRLAARHMLKSRI